MIDISFVQDNLPTPEEQLKVFKEILEKSNSQRNNILNDNPVCSFMYVDFIIPETINFIYERPDSGKILKSVSLKRLDFGIENILSKLAVSLIQMWNMNNKSNSKIMNVLAPSAMEDYTYLGYTFFADKLCLSGEVSLYIKEEDAGDITPPIPVLAHSR